MEEILEKKKPTNNRSQKMFKSTILFTAEGKTEDEAIDKILLDMNEVIRNDGQNIEVKEIKDTEE